MTATRRLDVKTTALDDVLLVTPGVHGDRRGFFSESYNERDFAAAIGREVRFVQDNHSRSARGVLRGLHYQVDRPQGKLLRVLSGEIYDVSVDLRRSSPTFGRWVGLVLKAEDHTQAWIPAGFAHGFLVLSDSADLLYKTTDYWEPAAERCIRYDDPDLAIDWPLTAAPALSARDGDGARFADADLFG